MSEVSRETSTDRDLRYARGEMSRDEYLRPGAATSPERRNRVRVFGVGGRNRILAVAAAILVATTVLAFALWGAFGPRGPFGSISASQPRQLSQDQVNALLSSSADYNAYASNNTVWLRGGTPWLVILASPMGHDETFVMGGLVNPTLHMARGMSVRVTAVNMDADAYHAWALTSQAPPYGSMGMMNGGGMGMPTGAMMGPSSGGMYWAQDISFTPMTSGQYWYMCPYPGHAAGGMYGGLIVS